MIRQYPLRHLEFSDGQAHLPSDFSQRLLRLKERTGLTWEGIAVAVGVDSRQLLRWRRGASPSGGAMLALFRLAAQIPDGVPELLVDDLAIMISDERQG